MRHFWLLVLCIVAGCGWSRVVLTEDFERNPMTHGWRAGWMSDLDTNVQWAQRDGGGHCLRLLNGVGASPYFTVQPGQYYRLTFSSKGAGKPMWAAFFTLGWMTLPGDHYASLEPSDAWTTQTYYFTTKNPGTTATIAFDTGGQGELLVDDVRVETVTLDQADAGVRAQAAALPPMTPPAPGEARLPHVLAKLKAGEPVRMVLLGDSIANDLSNAPLDLLLHRWYPKSQVELRFTGRGGISYTWLQFDIQERILDHKPDLLVLLCITNADRDEMTAALQKIIERTREALPETDILLVTPHVDKFSVRHLPGSTQREVLQAMAKQYNLPLVDLLAAWQGYLRDTKNPQEWLLRDVVHMHERGRLLSATTVSAWFAPGP